MTICTHPDSAPLWIRTGCRLGPIFKPLHMLDMATRAFTRGFCAYMISTKISLTGVTLCIRMGSSFLVLYNNFVIAHCTCQGCQLPIKKFFFFSSEYLFYLYKRCILIHFPGTSLFAKILVQGFLEYRDQT